jgi:hypothetical protein
MVDMQVQKNAFHVRAEAFPVRRSMQSSKEPPLFFYHGWIG